MKGSKNFVIGSKVPPVTSITSDASGIIFLKKRENPANLVGTNVRGMFL